MTKVVDIKKAKRQTSDNKKNESVEANCIDIVKEWVPKYITDKVDNDLLVIDYKSTWIHEDIHIRLACNVMYLLADGERVKFDDYKNQITKDLSILERVSSHAFPAFLKILLTGKIPFNSIMQHMLVQLTSVDSFLFFLPRDHLILPLTEMNDKGIEELKGIFYAIKADDYSTVVCKMFI